MMVPHALTLTMLLHLIVATNSQFMPGYPYPSYQQRNPMMQMPNGQQVMSMSNGPQAMPMANGATMMQMPPMPPMPPAMPYLPRLPGMAPPQMPFPFPMPMNTGRMPMVVMPHYSKKADKPRRRPRNPKRKRINIDSSSDEESCSSDAEFRTRNSLRTAKKRRQVLTPVVSYVTKDGYVVYQKKIKKEKAKDWLELSKSGSREYKDKNRQEQRDN